MHVLLCRYKRIKVIMFIFQKIAIIYNNKILIEFEKLKLNMKFIKRWNKLYKIKKYEYIIYMYKNFWDKEFGFPL